MIRLWRIRSPIVIIRGDADCRECHERKDAGRHLPLAECERLRERPCDYPEEHHIYQPKPLLARRADWLD